MSHPKSDLRNRQNSPRLLLLQRAISASHARAQRLEALRLGFSVAVAMAGFVATFVNSIATVITVVGGIWALVHSIGMSAWARREVERAAVLQEMFDTSLFGLPWNTVLVGGPLTADEVSKVARVFRGSEIRLRDYYEIPELPYPFDVLACQEQNLGWGARIRQRYAFTILAVVIFWSVAGVLLGALLQITVAALVLQFYVPSLGALMIGLETYRAQQVIWESRSRALEVVREQVVLAVAVPQARQDLGRLARQVQDVIFHTRSTYTRVPNLFFAWYQKQDRIDFQESMEELRRLVNGV